MVDRDRDRDRGPDQDRDPPQDFRLIIAGTRIETRTGARTETWTRIGIAIANWIVSGSSRRPCAGLVSPEIRADQGV